MRRCGSMRRLIERRQFARSQPHHPLDEVDAVDLLGHAVLDLQARVDFEEVELVRRPRRREIRQCPALA